MVTILFRLQIDCRLQPANLLSREEIINSSQLFPIQITSISGSPVPWDLNEQPFHDSLSQNAAFDIVNVNNVFAVVGPVT